jgi:hypothetical protein
MFFATKCFTTLLSLALFASTTFALPAEPLKVCSHALL